MMPTLSSLVAPEFVVIMITLRATSDDKIITMPIIGYRDDI